MFIYLYACIYNLVSFNGLTPVYSLGSKFFLKRWLSLKGSKNENGLHVLASPERLPSHIKSFLCLYFGYGNNSLSIKQDRSEVGHSVDAA